MAVQAHGHGAAGQAEPDLAVVLMLPGAWQTSRQSAYSMATRCMEEFHVFIDRESQCAGEYAECDPVWTLAQRWTHDARKLTASVHRPEVAADQQHAPLPRGLAHERVAPGISAWTRQPAPGREIGNDLGVEL